MHHNFLFFESFLPPPPLLLLLLLLLLPATAPPPPVTAENRLFLFDADDPVAVVDAALELVVKCKGVIPPPATTPSWRNAPTRGVDVLRRPDKPSNDVALLPSMLGLLVEENGRRGPPPADGEGISPKWARD
jgi:hypothetical protein